MIEMGFHWEVPPEEGLPLVLKNYTEAMFTTGRRVAAQRAADMVAWAKSNAPWQDRTGDARSGLNAIVKDYEFVIAEITIGYDAETDYSIWLELANGGKYAIISRTIDMWGPRLMADMQRIANLGRATLG
jgi:hypothetical protein